MKVLLGVTASVAAKLTSKLVLSICKTIPGVELKVVATKKAPFFFKSGDIIVPILTDKDEWPEDGYIKGDPVQHIDLGDWADVLLIAPLTADTLSDMAHGKADKFLTSIVLAWPRKKPIILAPAMNTNMWENPITQENLQRVESVYKTTVVGPVVGTLACKVKDIGAMANIEVIVASLLEYKVD